VSRFLEPVAFAELVSLQARLALPVSVLVVLTPLRSQRTGRQAGGLLLILILSYCAFALTAAEPLSGLWRPVPWRPAVGPLERVDARIAYLNWQARSRVKLPGVLEWGSDTISPR
jgi:hypothetical protein